jgi:MoaA/NifB/PqqE/SkfB family radical SAM enzyme
MEFRGSKKIMKYHHKLGYFFNKHKTLVSVELDLTNACNNRCPKCTGMKNNPASLNMEQLKRFVDEFAEIEGKSIILAGGGEPLIHPNFIEILHYIKSKGLKIGIYSNGLALNESEAKAIIDCCSFFRISLDAGSPEIYKKTHGMELESFNKVVENMKMFSRLKKELNSKISYGASFLTGGLTRPDILNFFKLCKECGLDYGQLKPFLYDNTDIGQELQKGKELYEDENFKVVSSYHKYQFFKDEDKRPYTKCWGMFFNPVVTADFKMYPCANQRQNLKYVMGDLNKNSIKEIMNSSKIIDVFNSINFCDCPHYCRNDDLNRELEYHSKNIEHEEFL